MLLVLSLISICYALGLSKSEYKSVKHLKPKSIKTGKGVHTRKPARPHVKAGNTQQSSTTTTTKINPLFLDQLELFSDTNNTAGKGVLEEVRKKGLSRCAKYGYENCKTFQQLNIDGLGHTTVFPNGEEV